MKVALVTIGVCYYNIICFFFDMSERLAKLDVDNLEVDVYICRVRYMLNYCHSTRSNRDLKKLLDHSRKCGATDGRDHVYAMLGLADETYGMQADYGERNTVQAVFTQLARSMIEKDESLDVLAHAHSGFSISNHLDLKHANEKLPSWVPDWSTRNSSRWSLRSAAGRLWKPESRWSFRLSDAKFLDGGTTLEISGTYIDTMMTCRSNVRTLSGLGYIVRSNGDGKVGDQLWKLQGSEWVVLLRPDTSAFKFVTIVDVELPLQAYVARKGASLKHLAAQMEKEPVRIRLI
jgi:hypothetical protein